MNALWGFPTLVLLWIVALAWRRLRGRSSQPIAARDEMAAVYDAKRRAAAESLIDDRTNPRPREVAEASVPNPDAPRRQSQ
jgi:hypothetical protein